MDYPFRSDGCSGVSDLNREMRVICVVHDWGYWMGGPESCRRVQDALFALHITRCKSWARFFVHRWLGVRLFGWAFMPMTKARWGYGWEYPRSGPRISARKVDNAEYRRFILYPDKSAYSERSQWQALGRAILVAAGQPGGNEG